MDWNDAKVFAAVATMGSLSSAARHLGMSQPTVGRHIEALERSLDRRLFDRGTRGYRLTEAGEKLLPKVVAREQAALAIQDTDGGCEDGLSGTVRLAIPQATSTYFSRYLVDFRRDLPDIQLIMNTSNHFVNMSRREADIALRTEMPKSGDLRVKHAYQIQVGIYGSPDYVAKNPQARSEERFHACDWVAVEESVSGSSARWLERMLGGKKAAIYCASANNVLHAAEAGAGLCLRTIPYVEKYANLVLVSDPIEELTYDYWLVSHSDALNQPRVRAVWDWLDDLIARKLR